MFFRGIASPRNHFNRIMVLKDENNLIEDRNAVINHVTSFVESIYSKEDWDEPILDILAFDQIVETQAYLLKREFEEFEVR